MTLHDSIILEVQNGKLARELRSTDLLGDERKVLRRTNGVDAERYRVGFDFYAESHIRTELANNAEDTGYWVRAGQPAKYKRVAEGLYRVIAIEEMEELLDGNEDAPLPVLACSQVTVLEERLACFLEQEPFQIFDRKRRSHHPQQPVVGFDARLSSYFWPNPSVSYAATDLLLQGFMGRARDLQGDLHANAAQVLTLFADICAWGGVQLPTDDAQVVVDNLIRAESRSRKTPASINSAWTKLYAIFYPDDFVIYDSRVATAMVAIAEQCMSDSELDTFKNSYPHLGKIAGRGGSRPRATATFWRNAYTSWPAQLDANELAKKVLSQLNRRLNKTYSLRQLEAVLFMEGY
ncbi:hypothetical protein NVV94_25880 [Pseudomonas sp. LS1212]|uniref:hypothetical protein n=1 Tax=Pseudomonas sp. LS1212 TaxID=2972478 RepID=UPI00215C57E5|nr:hypothetical protein [Pseudomonas sp. LS1212]UVJ43905.1 hypothetical protein NVV94_25880 [Pseudomonas sp. LS1212]